MTWRVARASVAGTAHQRKGGSCQDACQGGAWQRPDGEWVLALFAADGAGSASAAQAAAELACRHLCEQAQAWATNEAAPHAPLTPERLREWVEGLRERLLTQAADNNQSPRDWACTLLGVVCTASAVGYLQIGDGAIVARRAEVNGVVYWPDVGEYANETFFVTDADSLERLRVSVYTSLPQGLALVTDGLQRLALDYGTYQPHPGFFAPLFARLQAASTADIPAFEHELHGLLDSKAVNERTDDDKTLVLALWGG